MNMEVSKINLSDDNLQHVQTELVVVLYFPEMVLKVWLAQNNLISVASKKVRSMKTTTLLGKFLHFMTEVGKFLI